MKSNRPVKLRDKDTIKHRDGERISVWVKEWPCGCVYSCSSQDFLALCEQHEAVLKSGRQP